MAITGRNACGIRSRTHTFLSLEEKIVVCDDRFMMAMKGRTPTGYFNLIT